jgi:hypothetical protein
LKTGNIAFPGISAAQLGSTLIDSIGQAVRSSIAEHGDPAMAVVPEDPYLVPTHQTQAASAD